MIYKAIKFYRVVFTRCSDKENPPVKGFVRIRNEGTGSALYCALQILERYNNNYNYNLILIIIS